MEPLKESEERRGTGSSDQGSFDGDEPDPHRPASDADGDSDDDPESWALRFDERDDWLAERRRERRRNRERSWEQLQLAT